jgi:hypothetical protein
MDAQVNAELIKIWKYLADTNFIWKTDFDENDLLNFIQQGKVEVAYVIFNDFPERIKVSRSIENFIGIIKQFIEMCGNTPDMTTIIWQRVILYCMCDIERLFDILFDSRDEDNVKIILSINRRLIEHKFVNDVLSGDIESFLSNRLSSHLRTTYGMLIVMSPVIIDDRLLQFVADVETPGKEDLLAIYAKKNEL